MAISPSLCARVLQSAVEVSRLDAYANAAGAGVAQDLAGAREAAETHDCQFNPTVRTNAALVMRLLLMSYTSKPPVLTLRNSRSLVRYRKSRRD
jgi:hypothetical protein